MDSADKSEVLEAETQESKNITVLGRKAKNAGQNTKCWFNSASQVVSQEVTDPETLLTRFTQGSRPCSSSSLRKVQGSELGSEERGQI